LVIAVRTHLSATFSYALFFSLAVMLKDQIQYKSIFPSNYSSIILYLASARHFKKNITACGPYTPILVADLWCHFFGRCHFHP
jgi:hypothetical protein